MGLAKTSSTAFSTQFDFSFPIAAASKPLKLFSTLCFAASLSITVTGCSGSGGKRVTTLSPKVVSYGQRVPRGGGRYKIGKPYQIAGKWYRPREDTTYDRVGIASWYGDMFHGRRTANGEVYDMDALTAAHPTLPLPVYARVTNLANGKSIVVRINDRGPYKRNRIIDLSRRSAQLLGVIAKGTAKVRVTYLGKAPLNGDTSYEQRQLANSQAEYGRKSRWRPFGRPYSIINPYDYGFTNLANVKSIVVRINDRGPYKRNRIIDLSRRSAQLLGVIAKGTAKVRVTYLGKAPLNGDTSYEQRQLANSQAEYGRKSRWRPFGRPYSIGKMVQEPSSKLDSTPSYGRDRYFVQVGVFRQYDNASRLKQRLTTLGSVAMVPMNFGDTKLYKVTLGPFPAAGDANDILRKVVDIGVADARIYKK